MEHNFEHNRENSGALLPSIIGSFKSIIGKHIYDYFVYTVDI